jgi:hypothetical protein
VLRKHKKNTFLELPLELASSIPQKYDFHINNHILPARLLMILASRSVTRVEAEAILGRPATTNLGTKCFTFILPLSETFYFSPVSILHDDIACQDNVTAICDAHTGIALK